MKLNIVLTFLYFQTFGHKYGGTIYGFLFTSDIINNLLVGTLSSALLRYGGWIGFFLCLSGFGLLAFTITCFFPASPCPGPRPIRLEVEAALITCELIPQEIKASVPETIESTITVDSDISP